MILAIAVMAAGVALVGCLFGLATLVVIWRFGARTRAALKPSAAHDVTILKPLHGPEPRLAENLETFLTQDWAADIQLVAGVQSTEDPARKAAESLEARIPGRSASVVVDSTRRGANAKIDNIINLMPSAMHDILVLSDSDIAVAPGYLAHVVASLNEPGVGAVTCVYRGRGDAGFWSVMGAAGLSYQFLPNVLAGIAINSGDVCMGSTIALRRETLRQIGGFDRFVDILADDHAIGMAVRGLGLEVAIAPVIVTHSSTDTTLAELFRHELRWAATVRNLKPGGYFGTVVTHPLPFALLTALIMPGLATMTIVGFSLLCRTATKIAVDRAVGVGTAPVWMLPMRDMFSFGVFVASFFVRSVDWRGARLDVASDGRISASRERR